MTTALVIEQERISDCIKTSIEKAEALTLLTGQSWVVVNVPDAPRKIALYSARYFDERALLGETLIFKSSQA